MIMTTQNAITEPHSPGLEGAARQSLRARFGEFWRGEGVWQRAIRRFLRHKLAVAALIFLFALILLTLFAPLLIPRSPYKISLSERNQSPSLKHWFGTDGTGRDVFARTMVGGRVSLSVGLFAVGIAISIGVVMGSISGYFGGRVDSLIMRFTDMMMSFPEVVIIICLVAIIGPGLINTILVIGLLYWTSMIRIVRGQFLAFRNAEFVVAARCLGVPTGSIIFKHIFPNVVGPVMVNATFMIADAITLEAGLSFLGLGVQVPTPSWGNLIRDAQMSMTIMVTQPWMWAPAGIFLVLTVLCVNTLGDGLRDALDPHEIF